MDAKKFVANKRYQQFDVYVGRPSKWGNPFSHMPDTQAKFRVATRDQAVERFRSWFLAQPELVAAARRELRGKILGCWCAPARCHAEVLAEIANGEPGDLNHSEQLRPTSEQLSLLSD